MSTNKLIINLLVVFCCSFSSLLLPTQDTFAEAICVKKIGRKTRSGTVSLQRSVKKVSSGEACPRGHFLLLDTQTLTPATELTQGDTIRGVVGGAGTSSILQFLPISLPTASPVAIMDEDILIANTSNLSDISGGCSGSGCLSEDQKSKNASVCSGNFDNPTAPAGKLCIYVDVNSAAKDIEGQLLARSSNENGGSRFGVGFQWNTAPGFISKIKASWAYTAP